MTEPTPRVTLAELSSAGAFADRHIGVRPGRPAANARRARLRLARATCSPTPCRPAIREKLALALPPAATEAEVAAELRELAARNRVLTSMIGARLLRHDHAGGDPPQRPGEPGLVHRLHALPARDQPGPTRGAAQLPDHGRGPDRRCRSRAPRMLDESTAAAEAMALAHRAARKAGATSFVVDADVLPQTLDVVRTRAIPLGLEVVVHDLARARCRTATSSACWCSTRVRPGAVRDLAPLVARDPRAGRAGRRRRRPARADAADAARRGRAPTSRSAPPSASASRSASAARTPATSRCAPGSSGSCRAGWSASRSTPTASRPTGWRCRPASSTSAARRRPSNICTAQVLLAVIASDVRGLSRPGRAARDRASASTAWRASSPRDCAQAGVDVAELGRSSTP